MSITVENNTGSGKKLQMRDRYEIHTGSETTYVGALNWSIGDSEKVVIYPSKFIKEAKQHMQAQIISVELEAGDAPPLLLCHADFSGKGGHRLVFTMVENNGAPCLIHQFFPGNGGNGGGMSNFFKIWNFIREKLRT